MSIKQIEINVTLLGETGGGKSSVGNSILRRKAFRVGQRVCTETRALQYETAEVNGQIIRVFDLMSIDDNDTDNLRIEDWKKSFNSAMTEALTLSVHGFHAFLYVIPLGYSCSHTVVQTLEDILDEKIFKRFINLVFTRLDIQECEDKDFSESRLISQLTESESYNRLILKRDKRIVLFNNRTKDEPIQDKLVNSLIEAIDHLTLHGHRYKKEDLKTVMN